MRGLTIWCYDFPAVFATPHRRVYISGGRFAPVVVALTPPIKTYEQLASLANALDGGCTYQAWILPVLGFNTHPCSE